MENKGTELKKTAATTATDSAEFKDFGWSKNLYVS